MLAFFFSRERNLVALAGLPKRCFLCIALNQSMHTCTVLLRDKVVLLVHVKETSSHGFYLASIVMLGPDVFFR